MSLHRISTGDVAEIPPFRPFRQQSRFHQRSLAEDTSYSLDLQHSTKQHGNSDFAETFTRALTSSRAHNSIADHTHILSNTSAFAHPASNATRNSRRRTASIPRFDFDSGFSTAVNTRRNSNSSTDNGTWERLRDVLASARPGVEVRIEVYTGTAADERAHHSRRKEEDAEVRVPIVAFEEHGVSIETGLDKPGSRGGVDTWARWFVGEFDAAFAPLVTAVQTTPKVSLILVVAASCIGVTWALEDGVPLEHAGVESPQTCPLQTPTVRWTWWVSSFAAIAIYVGLAVGWGKYFRDEKRRREIVRGLDDVPTWGSRLGG
jgi:hypothetical protein